MFFSVIFYMYPFVCCVTHGLTSYGNDLDYLVHDSAIRRLDHVAIRVGTTSGFSGTPCVYLTVIFCILWFTCV